MVGHTKDCRFEVALNGAAPVECEHGYDVCPTCDICTCGGVADTPATVHGELSCTQSERFTCSCCGNSVCWCRGTPDDDRCDWCGVVCDAAGEPSCQAWWPAGRDAAIRFSQMELD